VKRTHSSPEAPGSNDTFVGGAAAAASADTCLPNAIAAATNVEVEDTNAASLRGELNLAAEGQVRDVEACAAGTGEASVGLCIVWVGCDAEADGAAADATGWLGAELPVLPR
jgi:hypothetical protein